MSHVRFASLATIGFLGLALVAAACSSQTSLDIADSTAEPTEAAATPTAEAAPSGVDTDDQEAGTDSAGSDGDLEELGAMLFGSSQFGADLSPAQLRCAIAKLADDLDLVERSRALSDIGELPLDDQADLAIIAFDCAPELVADQFAEGFASTGQVTLPPEVGACMIARMSESARQIDAM